MRPLLWLGAIIPTSLFTLTHAAALPEDYSVQLGNNGTQDLSVLQKRGNCGAGGGPCSGGLCCSQWGWCGSTPEYCDPPGCQSAYGHCSTPTPPPSPDVTCGETSVGKYTCKGTPFGQCCSSSGWCGVTDAHCGVGCQSAYGTCGITPHPKSPDGTCGSGVPGQYSCTDSYCCSSYGWCGATDQHCGGGCQKGFGVCW